MPIPAQPNPNPWVAKFQSDGIEIIASNILQVIMRDQSAAINWVTNKRAAYDAALGQSVALKPFAVLNNTRNINTQWPSASVIPRREDAPEGEGGGYLDEKLAVEVEIEDTGANANTLALRIIRLVQAVKAIIWSMSASDLTADLQINHGRLSVDVSPVIYTSFYNRAQNIYQQFANMTVTISLMEV